jgi:hypothetical protein
MFGLDRYREINVRAVQLGQSTYSLILSLVKCMLRLLLCVAGAVLTCTSTVLVCTRDRCFQLVHA